MPLAKYSMGIGDRFGEQGKAQLAAFRQARDSNGICVEPVWNKSHREHTIVGTSPADVRTEADAAVAALGWPAAYAVDADHINLDTVDLFIEASDFFTLDVAEKIGLPAKGGNSRQFLARHQALLGELRIPGIDRPFQVTREVILEWTRRYSAAVQEAGAIYRYIAARKKGRFAVEVSMDETDIPQTPLDLILILAALAEENVPVDTVAPKFSGRFNKGIDYAGDRACFACEFEQDVAAAAWAAAEFSLPKELKLSVHSGSDKFSLYPIMRDILQRHGAGLHLKTAGTTWLEEVIGLAEAGGEGLDAAKHIYREALSRYEEMCGSYAAVIDIDRRLLPSASAVDAWSGIQFAAALRHDPVNPQFNPHFRQLLHVSYKVAAEMGDQYLHVLRQHAETVAENVTRNLYERHILQVFPSASPRPE
jgi:hypothetical protein